MEDSLQTKPEFATLKDLPPEMRPRERLAYSGSSAMSPAELVALIISTGSRNSSAVTLGEQILGRFDSLSHFAAASVDELRAIPGVGTAKASKLVAAVELGRRLVSSDARERFAINDPQSAAEIFIADMRHLPVEHLRVAVLDVKNKLLRLVDAAIGGLNIAAVRPRDIFHHVLSANGASCILAHNHPSGDPQPSTQDVEMTRRMLEGASLLGIDLLDHIIIGDGLFVSLKQQGFF